MRRKKKKKGKEDRTETPNVTEIVWREAGIQ